MKKKPSTKKRARTDPVVEEIRAIRRKLWAEAGGTVTGYLELVRRRAAERGAGHREGRSRRRRSA